MGAKSRRIGARAECAVVRYAKQRGVPALRMIRTATTAAADPGDVHLGSITTGLVVVQVKGGQAAKRASEAQLGVWFADAEAQAREVPAADVAVLVWQTGPMARPGEWMTMIRVCDLGWLTDRASYDLLTPHLIRLPFGSLVSIIARGTA